jgi:hypothetical protein
LRGLAMLRRGHRTLSPFVRLTNLLKRHASPLSVFT